MLCVVLNASLPLKCHYCLCRVPYCQKTSHTLFIHVSPHVSVYGSTTVHKLWSTVQQRHRKPHIISTAHVFEEVEVSQPNAKQDLSGLSPGLRQSSLLLTLFHNWEFRNTRHMNQKATHFSHGTGCWAFFFFFSFQKRQQTESLSAEYHHWCLQHSLVTGHYVHWFPEASHPWEPINCRH